MHLIQLSFDFSIDLEILTQNGWPTTKNSNADMCSRVMIVQNADKIF